MSNGCCCNLWDVVCGVSLCIFLLFSVVARGDFYDGVSIGNIFIIFF